MEVIGGVEEHMIEHPDKPRKLVYKDTRNTENRKRTRDEDL